jgi:murein L,D-transpeptidase YcbB/YkuD
MAPPRWKYARNCGTFPPHRSGLRWSGRRRRDRLRTAVSAALSGIEPPFDGYWRTKRALAACGKLSPEGEIETLPSARRPLRPGHSYPNLMHLATVLRPLGDLPGNAVISEAAYSGTLVEAVKHFQVRRGLDSDGVLGSATLCALNVPLRQPARQIELALERWRWPPHSFARPPIIFNSPEFEPRARRRSSSPLSAGRPCSKV